MLSTEPMPEFLQVILLGIVEGITEFLPISSTGHLLIAEQWLGQRSDLFNFGIQAGAMLAVVAVFWSRLMQLLQLTIPANRDYLYKLSAAFVVSALGGLLAKRLGVELPETVWPVAIALIVGGVVILVIERLVARRPVSDIVSWHVAVWVGMAQILAYVFPGTSRSAATIFAAMLAGLTLRPAAIEFAFLVGVPTLFAATAYELLKLSAVGFAAENWKLLAVGFAVSAVVAFLSVRWLLHHVQTHRFTLFAWYRIALGALLLATAR
jgi:undecaprenyl-diphosphatase